MEVKNFMKGNSTSREKLTLSKYKWTIEWAIHDEIKNEMVRELAVKHLADSLDKILEELILERDIGAIEDVSFEKGIQDISDDYWLLYLSVLRYL